MRKIFVCLLCLSTSPALAQEATPGDATGTLTTGIAISTSYSISGPMLAKTPKDNVEEEQGYRKSLYQQSAKECADLLDTIAKSCTITNISVSTQITRQAGMADQIYASGSVTLQVELKD